MCLVKNVNNVERSIIHLGYIKTLRYGTELVLIENDKPGVAEKAAKAAKTYKPAAYRWIQCI